jgi:hypothetical protein
MNHGNNASKRHCGGCVFEHSGRSFTGVTLAPVTSVKGISKFLLKTYARAGRYLRTLIPYPSILRRVSRSDSIRSVSRAKVIVELSAFSPRFALRSNSTLVDLMNRRHSAFSR